MGPRTLVPEGNFFRQRLHEQINLKHPLIRLAETIEVAKRANVIKTSSLKRVIVDSTVMEKAIAHPADVRLPERYREHLVKAAAWHGLKLWSNYNREAPPLAGQIGRYAHAKQYKRIKRRCAPCVREWGV